MRRVAIIGAGVVGMAAAYTLRRRAYDVTLLDRGLPGMACSRSNAGWVCPSISGPLASSDLGLVTLATMLRRDGPLHIHLRSVPRLAPWLWRFWRHCNAHDYARGLAAIAALNAHTMQAFDAWAGDGITFEMHRAGLLWAFLDPRGVEKATRDFAALEPLGYRPPQPLDGAAVRAMEPLLGDAVQGGFVVDLERHVRPESLVDGLARRLAELGVHVRPGVSITGGRRSGGALACLRSANGEVHADDFVIAAGAWSGQLATSLGSPLHVQAGKGYSVTLPASSNTVQRPLYLAEAKVAVTPFVGHLRIAGTMELSGVNTHLDARRVAAMQRSAERFFQQAPAWQAGVAWVGARPITPDGLPYIGRLPGFRNVYVATGHGMLGVTLAPATAELLADVMDAGDAPRAPNPFDPAR